jgi:hypothetical protein
MMSQHATGESQSGPQTQASTLEPMRNGPEALSPKGITPIIGVRLIELVTDYDDIRHQQTALKSGDLHRRRPAAETLLNTIAPCCKLTDSTLQVRYSVAPLTSELHLHPPEMPNLANDPHAPELFAWLHKSGFIVQKLAHAAILIFFAIITACSPAFDDPTTADDDDDDDAEECILPHHHRHRPHFHISRAMCYAPPVTLHRERAA